MKEYAVKTQVIFSGIVIVKATNKREAKRIVEKNFNAIIGNLFDNDSEEIIDWDICSHSEETKTGTVL